VEIDGAVGSSTGGYNKAVEGRLQHTILAVEDDEHVRKVIRSTLKKADYAVLEASGGRECMAVIREHSGDIPLIILDLMMPGMNGFDVAHEIAAERPNTKVLYISGFAGSVAVESIANRNPEAILQKPFTSKELLGRIEALLVA